MKNLFKVSQSVSLACTIVRRDIKLEEIDRDVGNTKEKNAKNLNPPVLTPFGSRVDAAVEKSKSVKYALAAVLVITNASNKMGTERKILERKITGNKKEEILIQARGK